MWFTFIGSWFSFLVQCYCLTVYHDLQLPGRLEIRCVARQPGASTTLKPTSTVKRAVYDALLD